MFKISSKVRYVAEVMLDLATGYGQGPALLKDVAHRQNVPESYLENLMVPLKVAGLVRATRGAGGGYTLARPPSEIKLGHIVAALEGPISVSECVENPGGCQRSQFCATRDIWEDVEASINNILDSVTLEDMVRKQAEKSLWFKREPGAVV